MIHKMYMLEVKKSNLLKIQLESIIKDTLLNYKKFTV